MRSNEYLNYCCLLLILLFFNSGCNKKLHKILVKSQEDLVAIGEFQEVNQNKQSCTDPLNYIPIDPDLYPVRYIRVNFHFMDNENAEYNFGPEDGRKYMRYLLQNANDRLIENFAMNLPVGNETPNHNPRYQYVLTPSQGENDDAFYHHYDNDHCFFVNKGRNKNNYSREVIDKYKIGEDSILNIFIIPHHPDSLATGRHRAHRTGIALGNGLKIAGLAEKREEPWKFATLLNHEIGHFFSLKHSWTKHDGCDDTPPHPNCWHPDGTEKCPDPVSNNLMDYNSSQMAITPCQLGRVHKSIAMLNSTTRKVVRPDWCIKDHTKIYKINRDTIWAGAIDLNKDLLITTGNSLTIKCRLSMPSGGKIIVEPGATLHLDGCKLHNDCGYDWEGIQVLKNKNQSGKIVYTGTVKIENADDRQS